jgi:RNA polymerase sigma factor (sigma-70 family)
MAEQSRQNITDVINAYSKRLLGFIRKRVRRAVDAEDILQEVFYQFAGSLTPIEQVSSWLFTVARNKITDLQRKKKPALFADLFDEEDVDEEDLHLAISLPDNTDNPETRYIRSVFWEDWRGLWRNFRPNKNRFLFCTSWRDCRSAKLRIERVSR